MSLLKLHHISFTVVAVAYATPLKDPLALRRAMIVPLSSAPMSETFIKLRAAA